MTLLVAGILAANSASESAALTIRAVNAAIRTEGGPNPGGGYNLWSNGSVTQPVRVAAAGVYTIKVRAWGSPAGGVWPEMALMIDGRSAKTVFVNRAQPADYTFTARLAQGIHDVGVAFLNDAVIGNEDRNLYLDRFTIDAPPGITDPVLAAKQEVVAAAKEREQQVLAATGPAIEKYRKTDVKLRIVDPAGQPLRGMKISVEQTSHDFLFGCNIYGFDTLRNESQNAIYKDRFKEMFNYATVGFYWQSYEPERGKPNYGYTDKVVRWCRENGIRMKGHPLLWGHPAGIPRWSHGQPSADIQRQRIHDIMHRYGDRIEFWEVVNEAAHLPEPKIDGPYRWARQIYPRAYLIINDYAIMSDGGPGVFKLLTGAKQNGVPFDGIGIQAHEPATMRFPLDRVHEILDQYASLGKQLHITEFTPTSSGKRMTGPYCEGVWDEAAQADYAVKFYRTCFARPALRAITWWDLCDASSWLPGGGMLRADMSPKPVYEQLKRLIHQEWTTRLSTQTDAEGRCTFRGFYGKYRIVLDVPGHREPHVFQVKRDQAQEIVIPAAH